jgi:hypothetical protein
MPTLQENCLKINNEFNENIETSNADYYQRLFRVINVTPRLNL